MQKSAGFGTGQIANEFVNPGVVSVTSGTLRLRDATSNWINGSLTVDGGSWIVATTDSQAPSAVLQVDGLNPILLVGAHLVLDGPGTEIVNQIGMDLLTDLQRILPTGSLTIQNGRNLALSPADFMNEGVVAIGAASTLSLDGQYEQTGIGGLSVGLGGNAASGRFGHLTTTGDVNLDGALGIEFVDGFGPFVGDSWQAMSFANRAGDFVDIDIPLLGQSPSLEVLRNPDQVVINALVSASDLRVVPGSIVAPIENAAGEQGTIEFTVENLSTTDAEGDWVDSIYLSENSVLDASDLLIERHPHTGGLGGSSSYDVSIDAPLPANVEGLHRVLVVVESRGFVPDSNRANNFGASTGVTNVTVPELALGNSIAVPIDTDQDLYFRVDVPIGEDVTILAELARSLQADLFASFGRLPTRSDFDLRAQTVGEVASTDRTINIANQSGTWYLLVHGGPEADGVQTLTIGAEIAALRLDTFSTDKGASSASVLTNVGEVTLLLRGARFSSETQPVVVATDSSELFAKRVVFKSSTEIIATFDLQTTVAGQYQR